MLTAYLNAIFKHAYAHNTYWSTAVTFLNMLNTYLSTAVTFLNMLNTCLNTILNMLRVVTRTAYI